MTQLELSNPNASATSLSRSDVARLLGVHKSTVRRLEQKGVLTPFGDVGERRWFSLAQVAAALSHVRRPHRTAGDLAALAFWMLGQGRSEADVVVALRITPRQAGTFFRDWTRCSKTRSPGAPRLTYDGDRLAPAPKGTHTDRLKAADAAWRPHGYPTARPPCRLVSKVAHPRGPRP